VEQGKQRILIRVKGDHEELNLSRRRIVLVNIVCRIRSRGQPQLISGHNLAPKEVETRECLGLPQRRARPATDGPRGPARRTRTPRVDQGSSRRSASPAAVNTIGKSCFGLAAAPRFKSDIIPSDGLNLQGQVRRVNRPPARYRGVRLWLVMPCKFPHSSSSLVPCLK